MNTYRVHKVFGGHAIDYRITAGAECVYLFRMSMPNYQPSHEMKHAATVAIHAKHSNVETAHFWEVARLFVHKF